MTPTADTLVQDDLWQAIQPLLPTPPVTCWRRLRDCGAPGCGSSCTTFLDQLGREGKLDRGGIPLAACVSGHTHDSMLVEAIVDAVPPVKGPRGRPGRPPPHVVERSLAWLVGHRRLQGRHERRADVLLGFVQVACALTCLNRLNQPAA